MNLTDGWWILFEKYNTQKNSNEKIQNNKVSESCKNQNSNIDITDTNCILILQTIEI